MEYVLAVPGSFLFCSYYFPLKIAWKLPILISRNVFLLGKSGKIEIRAEKIRTGMIRIGFGQVGTFDKSRARSIWECAGKIIFHENANMGHGTKISVGKDGVLELGKNFTITAESALVCHKNIHIGDDFLMSWD